MKTTLIHALTVVGISSILVSCSTGPKLKPSPAAEAPSGSAGSVLKQMRQAYSSVSSYADSGVVYTYRNGVRNESSLSFRINFLRPDHLRFEMTDNIGSPHFPEDYKVLWSYGNATYTWAKSYPQIQTSRDVTSAIAQFTGISSRSAHNIPSLLQTNFGWQEYLYNISAAKILGEEVFEGVDCYHIQGEGKGGRRFDLWLGKADYLIRKVQTTYDPNLSEEEIHRGIAINQPISPEMLRFTPPMSAEK